MVRKLLTNRTLYARWNRKIRDQAHTITRVNLSTHSGRGLVSSHLDELYAHQEWADAEHWRAIEAHPPALADKAIRERLLHIHLVQHGFLWVTSPHRPEFAFKKVEDFPSMTELKTYARQGLNELGELLKKTDQSGWRR
jgi:hypothetical protein